MLMEFTSEKLLSSRPRQQDYLAVSLDTRSEPKGGQDDAKYCWTSDEDSRQSSDMYIYANLHV